MRPNSLWLARFRRAILFFAAMVWFGFASNFAGSSPEESTSVPTVRTGSISLAQISGSINPASSDYLQKAIRQSEEENSALLVIELDTPGGLVASTKDIIQAMLNSNIPIVVYVSPRGAWAGSAGTFITMAAHVAAMAPGSSIGAAHPVGIGGGGKPQQDQDGKEGPKDYSAQKAENLLAAFIESIAERRGRNVEWAEKAVRDSVAITAPEALEIRVIDLIAEDRAELIALLDGWEVASLSGKEVLDLSGSSIKKLEMSLLTRVLNVLVDPNVAMILLLAGAAGLYLEFNQPGLLLPGIAGGICILLGLIAMQILPFSWVGVLLMAVGLGCFVAEVVIGSYGIFFIAGILCLLLGGSMLFDRPEVSDLNVDFWSVLVPLVLGFAVFGAVVAYAAARSMTRAQVSGVPELIGMTGRVTKALNPEGMISVRGELWKARSGSPLNEGERVEVIEVRGLELRVRQAEPQD